VLGASERRWRPTAAEVDSLRANGEVDVAAARDDVVSGETDDARQRLGEEHDEGGGEPVSIVEGVVAHDQAGHGPAIHRGSDSHSCSSSMGRDGEPGKVMALSSPDEEGPHGRPGRPGRATASALRMKVLECCRPSGSR
jgi:hypothetical protein